MPSRTTLPPTKTSPPPTKTSPPLWIARIYACRIASSRHDTYFKAEYDYNSGAEPTVFNAQFCETLAAKTSSANFTATAVGHFHTMTIPGTIHGAYSSCTYLEPTDASITIGSMTCAGLPHAVPCPTITDTGTSSCTHLALSTEIEFQPVADCTLPTHK